MKKTLSLSEIMHIVESWFGQLFDDFSTRVEAEVVKVNVYPNRVYIDFVEYDTSWTVRTKTTWIVRETNLLDDFLKETWVTTKDLLWKKIHVYVSCTFHHLRWFSLRVHELSAEYTLGQLQKQSKNILLELKRKWILERNKQTSFGYPPYHFAIITSARSEGFKDFQSILAQEWSSSTYQIFDTTVHWNAAKKSVLTSLKQIHSIYQDWSEQWQWSLFSFSDHKGFDWVVILRGWWGKEWMLWQNDAAIAEEICRFPVPVILAVWHTTDTSVLDHVCYHTCKTPTDVWYYIQTLTTIFSQKLKIMIDTINRNAQSKLSMYRERLEFLKPTISSLVATKMKFLSTSIEHMYGSIRSYSVDSILSKWFALLRSSWWELLTRKKLLSLTWSDEIIIQTQEKEFSVKIVEVSNREETTQVNRWEVD